MFQIALFTVKSFINALITLSQQQKFCVPLLEAMHAANRLNAVSASNSYSVMESLSYLHSIPEIGCSPVYGVSDLQAPLQFMPAHLLLLITSHLTDLELCNMLLSRNTVAVRLSKLEIRTNRKRFSVYISKSMVRGNVGNRTLNLPSTHGLLIDQLTILVEHQCLPTAKIFTYVNSARCKSLQLVTSIPMHSLLKHLRCIKYKRLPESVTVHLYARYHMLPDVGDVISSAVMEGRLKCCRDLRWIWHYPHMKSNQHTAYTTAIQF